MKAFIYEMKNTANGKVYIGVTCNLEQRIRSWLCSLKRKNQDRYPSIESIKQDFLKHSENIEDIISFDILDVCEEDIMFITESKHILKAKESGPIYNLNYGPEAIAAKEARHKRQLQYIQSTLKKIKKEKKQRPLVIKKDKYLVYHFLDYPTIGIGYSEKDDAYYVNMQMQVNKHQKHKFFQNNIKTKEEAIAIKKQVEVDFGLRSSI